MYTRNNQPEDYFTTTSTSTTTTSRIICVIDGLSRLTTPTIHRMYHVIEYFPLLISIPIQLFPSFLPYFVFVFFLFFSFLSVFGYLGDFFIPSLLFQILIIWLVLLLLVHFGFDYSVTPTNHVVVVEVIVITMMEQVYLLVVLLYYY